jgi:hypothetical protein
VTNGTKELPKRHGGSPIFTNASVNRKRAEEAYRGGLTPAEIAAEWPLVWTCTEGKLGQKYDYELADGSGRYETRYQITAASVREAIARKSAALRAQAAK